MLRVRLLGVLALEIDGVDVAPPSSRGARLLLARLALDRRPHGREALAACLWPGVLRSSARASLRTALTQLRAALGADAGLFLQATRECVALAGPGQVWTDVADLERALDLGQTEAALALWSGELLIGLEGEWIYDRREELRARVCDALGAASGDAEDRGDIETALHLIRRQAALDPLAEEPQRELIRRLAGAGDRAAALVAYERLVRRLREQLQTIPSPATRELAWALRRGMPVCGGGAAAGMTSGGEALARPPVQVGQTSPQPRQCRPAASGRSATGGEGRALAAGRGTLRFNLPPVAAAFVGREAELDAIGDAFSTAGRAVITQAITGLGGVGKSQLAARYVQQRTDGYDVVAWIRAEDGGIGDLAQLAVRLGAPSDDVSPHELAQLALDWLGDEDLRWLLVLDNVASPEDLERCCPRRARAGARDVPRPRHARVRAAPRRRRPRRGHRDHVPHRTGPKAPRWAGRAAACGRARHPSPRAVACGRVLPERHELHRVPRATRRPARPRAVRQSPGAVLLNRASLYLRYAEPGRRDLAISRVVVAHAERLLGTEHPATLATRNDLAASYHWSGRTATAIAIFERLVADHERIPGAEHPATLRARNNLAYNYRKDGRPGEAIAILEPLVPDRRRLLGDKHHDTLTSANNLARAYNDVGRIAEAIAILEPLVADHDDIFGADHPSTLHTRHNLALAYVNDGRVGAAIAILEPLLVDFERVLGKDHPYTLRVAHTLGAAYLVGDRRGDAVAILEPVLEARERTLGRSHPETLATRERISVARRVTER
jgi:DNA-binding SARP family transcriptional activator